MPELIVRETTVYTLEELKELFPHAYDKAIEKVIMRSWEGWEPQWYSDDIEQYVKSEFPTFYMERTSLEWSTNPNWIHGKGSINVAGYMRSQKLCNAYRSLWSIMRTHELNADVPVNFGFGYGQQVDMGDLYDEVNYFVDYDSARYRKICDEIDRLRANIHKYMDSIEDRLLSNLSAEIDYQWSDEKAVEDAEIHEFKFTEEGEIFHG